MVVAANYKRTFGAFDENGVLAGHFDDVKDSVLKAHTAFLRTKPSERKVKQGRIDANLKEVAFFQKSDLAKAKKAAHNALINGSMQAAKWLEDHHITVTANREQIDFYREIQVEMEVISSQYLQKNQLKMKVEVHVEQQQRGKKRQAPPALELENHNSQKRQHTIPSAILIAHGQEEDVQKVQKTARAAQLRREKKIKEAEEVATAARLLMGFRKVAR